MTKQRRPFQDTLSDAQLVDARDACPTCGNRLEGALVWNDDDQVRCSCCGTVYTPGAEVTL